MHGDHGFEDLVLKNTTPDALERFVDLVDWPRDLKSEYPDLKASAYDALRKYFRRSKGTCGIADFLGQCSESEIPRWIRDVCISLKSLCENPKPEADTENDDEDDITIENLEID
jgi:putative ATP-dependent endonuclease of the OLD family